MIVDNQPVNRYLHFMQTKDKFFALAEAGLTARQIAVELGVTRQRVYQLAKSVGVTLTAAYSDDAPKRPVRGARHEYGITLQPSWSGSVTEMTVAVDLMKRGFFVYQSIARTGPFDLLAYSDTQTWRVVVKSICSINQGIGSIKPHNHDIIARVMPDGVIFYSIDPGTVEQRRRPWLKKAEP